MTVKKKVAKKATKKKVVKKAAAKVVKKKVAKKTTKKVVKKKVVKKSNHPSKTLKKEQVFLRKNRPEELRSDYNESAQTYRGLKIEWTHIQRFQIFFLEAQYKLTDSEHQDMIYTKTTFETPVARAKELKRIQLLRLRAIEELQETYKVVWAIRKQVFSLYQTSEAARAEIDRQCKDDPILWINTFAWTYDPRLTNVGIPAQLPFVLYPAQVKVINKVDECYRTRKHFLIEKSRAEGLTEMLCAYTAWRFLYTPGFKCGWGSRVMSLVDQLGNEDTIFEKLRRILYKTPSKMRPVGWLSRQNNKYDNSMRLTNPENGSAITGEGGEHIGRGGRNSIYFVDEAASLKFPEAADKALSQNTNSIGLISTPMGTNYFYDKKISDLVEVITAWWWRNPSKNLDWHKNKRPKHSAWYEKEKMRSDPVAIAQEIDIDYNASIGGVLIPSAWVNAAVDLELESDQERVAGYDLAAG